MWLKKAKVSDVDFDLLLSVELPAWRTERERVQLMASSAMDRVDRENLESIDVGSRCRLTCHTEALSRSVEDVFGGWRGLAEYVCLSEGVATEKYEPYEQQARRLYTENRLKPAASVVRTRKELEALTTFLACRIEPEVSEAVSLRSAIETQRSELDDLEIRIESFNALLDRRIDDTDAKAVDGYNADVKAHNLLVERYESVRRMLNAHVDKYNSLGLSTARVMEIGGGVSLHPDSFTVHRTAKSAALDRFESAASGAGREWTQLEDGSQWIRSRSEASGSDLPRTRIGLPWECGNQGTNEASYRSSVGRYWFNQSRDTGRWRDQRSASDETVCRLGDLSGQTIHIATYGGSQIRSCIIGTRQEANRIVFVKSDKLDELSPDIPPLWYGSQR